MDEQRQSANIVLTGLVLPHEHCPGLDRTYQLTNVCTPVSKQVSIECNGGKGNVERRITYGTGKISCHCRGQISGQKSIHREEPECSGHHGEFKAIHKITKSG